MSQVKFTLEVEKRFFDICLDYVGAVTTIVVGLSDL
jgi:hypothetical protein